MMKLSVVSAVSATLQSMLGDAVPESAAKEGVAAPKLEADAVSELGIWDANSFLPQ